MSIIFQNFTARVANGNCSHSKLRLQPKASLLKCYLARVLWAKMVIETMWSLYTQLFPHQTGGTLLQDISKEPSTGFAAVYGRNHLSLKAKKTSISQGKIFDSFDCHDSQHENWAGLCFFEDNRDRIHIIRCFPEKHWDTEVKRGCHTHPSGPTKNTHEPGTSSKTMVSPHLWFPLPSLSVDWLGGENLNRTPSIFPWNIGFSCKCSLKPTHWLCIPTQSSQ